MKVNKLFFLLGALVSLVALWFVFFACKDVIRYALLNERAPACQLQWQVEEDSASCYYVRAHYRFSLKDKEYSGETLFLKAAFPNVFAARSAVAQLQRESWTVWYNKSHPTNNSLQKLFPFKSCIRALLTVALSMYFFALSTIISRRFKTLA